MKLYFYTYIPVYFVAEEKMRYTACAQTKPHLCGVKIQSIAFAHKYLTWGGDTLTLSIEDPTCSWSRRTCGGANYGEVTDSCTDKAL